jgi:hypothetical protein
MYHQEKYHGIERRRHKVYVTRNTEYHVRDGVCVAVRDRRTSAFRDAHIAIQLKVEGSIKLHPSRTDTPDPSSAEPEIGDAILFLQPMSDGRPRQITTSRIERIERPAKADALRYAS